MPELTKFLQEKKHKSEEDLQRQRDLWDELAKQPSQMINGLVSPSGASSSNPHSLLDRQLNWFEGEARWGLRKIRIYLSPADIKEPSKVIGRAEEFWAQRKNLARQACEVAAATLLEVKNGSWLDQGELPMTQDQFMRKMKLESITVREDGDFDFWFEDGDIFWGHSIEVRADSERGFFDAGVQG